MTNQELLQVYSAYLPYEVKCIAQGYNIDDFSDPVKPKKLELVGISDCKWCEIHEIGRTVTEQSYFKETYLLLRPLSDLTKEIEHNGEKFVPKEKLNKMVGGITPDEEFKNPFSISVREGKVCGFKALCINVDQMELYQKLFEWHFDVFGLIEKDLAINLNKIK